MNQITPFDYQGKTVRIMDLDGQPWWVASDVCCVLGISNPTEAIKSLDADEKNTLRITEGIRRGNPNVNIINEPGLYRLLSRSNKKRAKKFQRWVFHDVLPEIRKTGSYGAETPKLPQNYREALQHLIAQVEKNEQLEAANKALEPKAQVYDFVSGCTGLVGLSDCAKIIGLRPHVFTALLRGDNFCFVRKGKMVPYERYIEKGLFEMKLVPARDGSRSTYRQMFVTPLGVNKLREIYNPGQGQKRLFA